ncbi:hypothetical protein AMK59_6155 [Oryctes borbonicus]|uniref:Fibrinogen C-terminal domain-containing protein n=1 Tax=Oryctes borbonicus TaxID=1629725 RepID=A0A0T6B0H7_9SCAR|nr:hypothetical protein AMK59_6155 [Oryctes borbonicus]
MDQLREPIGMFCFALFFAFALFRFGSCVPPSPTDSLMDDVNGIKVSLKYLAASFDKWNTVYNNQVEPRVVSSSNLLAAIDSNIRNLQDRAHVWDTFQLHVSAWNDQLSTTDRKLDIISNAQEKLFSLDSKLSFISNLDYKLDTVLKKLQEIEESLNTIPKKIEEKRQGESLFGEFATRGILSTLKLIEKKLDKVHLTGQNLMLKQNKNDEFKTRLVKCNNPANLEEILRDISSKVDVIFDKISERDETPEQDNDDYFEDQQFGSGEVSDEMKSDSDLRLLRRLLKRIGSPCKQSSRMFDGVMFKLKEIENSTAVLIKRNGRNCKANTITIDAERIASNLTQLSKNMQLSLNSHFSEQRAHFTTMLKSSLIHNCLQNPTAIPVNLPKVNITQQTILSTTVSAAPEEDRTAYTEQTATSSPLISTEPYEIEIAENVTSCEELPIDAKAGVYNFTDAEDTNLRYCREHWTIIQRRDNFADLQNFSLPWVDYKFGFGDVSRDFWIGNEFIYEVSNMKNLMLRIELEDFEGNVAWAQYNYFKIASERENYKLFLGAYTGDASDSLSSHSNSSFSTYDRKNDAAPSCCPCSLSYGGGWWFNSCFEANLNGVYYRNPSTNEYFRGIIWEHWLGNYSLKKTVMMIKPMLKIGESVDENVTAAMFFPNIEDP